MTIEVIRATADGTLRHVWTFRADAMDGRPVLRLDRFVIQTRPAGKGRWSKVTSDSRWERHDERRYWSGLPRPTSVPVDVYREAVDKLEPPAILIGRDEISLSYGEIEP